MKKLPILKKLEEELKKLERELRVEIPKELELAASHGDLRENAEHQAAKERQHFLEARATQISSRINSLSSLKLADIPRDAVAFGSRVRLEEIASGIEVVYELVTPEEVDPRNGKVSISSPIGQAIFKKSEGDDVTIKLPTGVKEYGVVKIETLHDLLEDDGEG